MKENDIISEEILEGMGISRPVYEEIQTIVGRLPSVDELSTLMAMWQASGYQQGLLSWLKGQPHSAERHDYMESETEPESKEIREPRVKECIEIAQSMFPMEKDSSLPDYTNFQHRGDAIYMVGDVSGLFVNSDYGRRYLHLADNPITLDSETETEDYIELILGSLQGCSAIYSRCRIGCGGLFGTLVHCAAMKRFGFDILACREVRLDAFLFGEAGVRYIVSMDEPTEDFFVQKVTEARINCCFLGYVTKGRVLVDDMDFGPISRYLKKKKMMPAVLTDVKDGSLYRDPSSETFS